MTAAELNRQLNALWPELDTASTVDRLIVGDPEAVIRGVGVMWMPYIQSLRDAAAGGANVIVTHEPTFYDHYEHRRTPPAPPIAQAIAEKQDEIQRLGLTILRCHDVWDAVPESGVPFAWARFLALGPTVRLERYLQVCSVEPAPAAAVARRIAARTATLGQPAVGLYGDPERVVRAVGLGTGCYCDPHRLFEMGADLAIVVDDVLRAWTAGEWSNDHGQPIVVVNHGVAEEPAMADLADQVRRFLPGIAVRHLPQGCSYRSITS